MSPAIISSKGYFYRVVQHTSIGRHFYLMQNEQQQAYILREVDGIRFAEAGEDSQSTPVLLLHGMMGDISNWESVFEPVSQAGFRVICPILPVYTLPVRNANLQGVVDFVERFMSLMGLSKVVLTGNSLGGHVAALFAIQHPEKVSGVVLAGASGIYEVEMSSSIMRRKDREYLRPRVGKTFFNPVHVTEELLDDVIEIINNREKAIRLIRFARSVDKGSVKDDLHRISAPTLLVWGRQDQITPPDVADTFHAGIPNSELHWVDECGHVPMIEQPIAFSGHLIDFLRRLESSSTAA